MTEINLPPFFVGQKVMSLISWNKVRGIYGYNYPIKNQVVTVLDIIKNSGGEWHIIIPDCEVKLWAKNFSPIQENFQSISLEKILEKETSLISAS